VNPDKSGYGPAGIGRTTSRRHSPCAVRWSVSPHPSPLPWGEGELFSTRSAVRTFRLPLRVARCSLSLRERVRVGNCANYPLAYRIIPGTVELDESFDEYLFSHSHARHVLRQTRLRWLRVSSVVARASRPCESCNRHTGGTPVPLPSENRTPGIQR